MRTQKSINEILGRIMETGGMSEAMEPDLAAIRDEFQQRDGYLRQVSDPWDEEADEVEITLRTANGDEARYMELEGKYNDLVRRYQAKFFSGGSTHEDDTAVDVPPADVDGVDDGIYGDDITVDKLFKEVE